MRVLVTGHNGYIGCSLLPLLQQAGHEVVGLDNYLYETCTFGPDVPDVPSLRKDVRDVELGDLEGFDAVIHLAAISNDPVGDLNPDATYSINHRASTRLAKLAKEAGVERFLFSSSCSLYGAAGDDILDESASFNPVTPYGESKLLVENDLRELADDDFSPTYLRNATAYGLSARLRGDLVVNNLTGYAVTTGQVLLKSDGSSWRPLVHIEDISRAFVAILEAPRELVHNEPFNVGRTEENYKIRDVATIVGEVVPGSTVTFADGASPDIRNYRVNCDKIMETLPAFQPVWTVRKSVEELYAAYVANGLELDDFLSRRFMRIKHVRELQEEGVLDDSLRRLEASVA
ncbi:SDR family oxidoreductase [Solirubrobacter sp. CPCC 204708]|uniref:SDR family oxidoreductase n=1 Tax=Solirubrobacter deserti TaxID=2282478 RepID=A0ABT4RIQ6_9ACTN|nr:SDR family oxidoreductase [Solirubrobacter deserti]MBE2320249.1 SDR family oxidoreductase [Solirubrobacter deserti]MDA0138365.1 SDR family oxidoreductase [Solirubrobacter deserti]